MLIISKCDYKLAIDCIKKGGLVAFPTETVFGLGCLASKEEYFNKLCMVKNRPADKPFTLMCSSIEQALPYVEIDETTKKIVDKFFPGQLTLIVKAKENIPHYLDLGTGYIGIRIPADDFVLKMIDEIGEPLLVTSANISGQPVAETDEDALYYFKDKIDVIVKGKGYSKIPSTVVILKDNKLNILRQGIITKEELEEVING